MALYDRCPFFFFLFLSKTIKLQKEKMKVTFYGNIRKKRFTQATLKKINMEKKEILILNKIRKLQVTCSIAKCMYNVKKI